MKISRGCWATAAGEGIRADIAADDERTGRGSFWAGDKNFRMILQGPRCSEGNVSFDVTFSFPLLMAIKPHLGNLDAPAS